ncbi:MAG TPA: hypothetical protein VML91_05290 [Burkholderiales bacterium]|nr:hypothetical protein [Burkholderiales bacterium]
MIRLGSIVALAAAVLLAAAVQAEPITGGNSDDRAATEPAPRSGSFKQEVKRAWSDTRAGIHRTGRELRDGVRSAGRATAEAFRSGWRKVKESFAGAPEPAGAPQGRTPG